MTTNVNHLRLINGDELFAKVIEENDGYYILEDPYSLDEATNPENGTDTVLLSKYAPYNSGPIQINKNNVLSIHPIQQEFERYYFTSMRYNKKFVEKRTIAEVQRVSRMMENIIDTSEGREVRLANGEVILVNPAFLAVSNSVH